MTDPTVTVSVDDLARVLREADELARQARTTYDQCRQTGEGCPAALILALDAGDAYRREADRLRHLHPEVR